jgi:SAM-dependent methyltransferase
MTNREIADPQLQDLETEYDRAMERSDPSRAIELAKQMNDILEPRHFEAVYGIARAYAMLAKRGKAYVWLHRAVEAGFWDVQRLRSDDAFASLREEESFLAVVRGAWAGAYIRMLERDERDDFQKPDQIMQALGFRPGERVADVGSGSGYFTIPVAKAVGPNGVVWAIDVFQEMLDFLVRRVDVEKLRNIRPLKIRRDEPEIPDDVDTILVIDTLHYVKDKADFARRLGRGLSPGGRIVIIDYTPKPFEERPWGPTPEQQVPRELIDAAMAEAGFKPNQVHDFLPEQYFVVYGAA